MNILVTGANGQLGHEMQRVALGSNHHYIFTDVADGYEQLDITNLDAIRAMVKERSVSVIVNISVRISQMQEQRKITSRSLI